MYAVDLYVLFNAYMSATLHECVLMFPCCSTLVHVATCGSLLVVRRCFHA